MPIILRENIENGVIGIWQISEEIDELFSLAKLSVPETITYLGISAPHRKKEWLATRTLLNELIGKSHRIKYHNDGRPYIENCPTNISISHSSGYIALLLLESFIPGIDIELITRQVGKVANRFLSSGEIAFCNENPELSNHMILMHWCAKEAIFKIIPFSDIEFSSDIQISMADSTHDSGSFQGTFNDKLGLVPITLYYKILKDILIVWGWVEEERFKS